jgi:hypothetical protein
VRNVDLLWMSEARGADANGMDERNEYSMRVVSKEFSSRVCNSSRWVVEHGI